MMVTVGNNLRMWWTQFDVRFRQSYFAVALLLAATGAIAASVWLRAEHERLSRRQVETLGQLRELQDHLGEIERLKGLAAPPTVMGPALLAAIAASLQSRGLLLTVTAVDSERLRVQGTADFDQVMHWLGSVQQSQRLRLASMSVSRRDGAAKFELMLAAAQE